MQVVSAQLNGVLNYKYNGTCDMYNYMIPPEWQKKLIVLDARDIPVSLSADTHYVINQIAEADTHQKALDRLQGILDQHPQIPVFNPPHVVQQTRRDRVYAALHDLDGVRIPHTFKINPHHPREIVAAMAEQGLNYPVIIKASGLHGGKQTVLLKSAADLDELHALALDGRDYYLIEYIDTAQDGVYAKYRLVMVNGELYPRHFRFSDNWLVHYFSGQAYMDRFPAYHQRELDLFAQFENDLKPQLAARARAIHARIPMDLVGIDCCLLPDGQWLIFEFNANMLLLTSLAQDPTYLKVPIETIKAAVLNTVHSRI